MRCIVSNTETSDKSGQHWFTIAYSVRKIPERDARRPQEDEMDEDHEQDDFDADMAIEREMEAADNAQPDGWGDDLLEREMAIESEMERESALESAMVAAEEEEEYDDPGLDFL